MPETPSLFQDQAREQPDPSTREGRKIVYDDTEEEVSELPDGRFDGRGGWSYKSLRSKVLRDEKMTHNMWALYMLYEGKRITRKQFADSTDEQFGRPSFKLPARIADLRQIDDCPPIRTDEESDPTEWFIPQVDTVQ